MDEVVAPRCSEFVDEFVNSIRMISDQNREVLRTDTVEGSITTTQGHVLMLLAKNGPQTNKELGQILQVSPAAMTKVMKALQTELDPMVTLMPDETDGRVNRWSLTSKGIALASTHMQQHRDTLNFYDELLLEFSEAEQATIQRFVCTMREKLTEEA